MTKLIQVFANKDWEADPLVTVLKSPAGWQQQSIFEAIAFEQPPTITIPKHGGGSRLCTARLRFRLLNASIEVWCIRDLMEVPPAHKSSSQEKARVLAEFKTKPSILVAFGTAAFPGDRSYNGCVAIGSRTFTRNPFADNPNPESGWTHPKLDSVLSDTSPACLMRKLRSELWASVESRFLTPPLNAATPPELILSPNQVAVGSVNVTKDSDYARVDQEAVEALRAKDDQPVASIETTHGLIRMVIPSDEFLYVSGIVNRLGKFETEVKPRLYAQNFVAAHNAGIALAWMLPTLSV